MLLSEQFNELLQLARLYRKHETTNPIQILQEARTIHSRDRALLQRIVAHARSENIVQWRAEVMQRGRYRDQLEL